MVTEIRVPTLGESVSEATVGQWFKQAGDLVTADEPLVELETDKVTVEVPAPASGVLAEIAVQSGDTVAIGTVLGAIRDADGKQPAPKSRTPAPVKSEAPVKAAAATPAAKPKLEREPSPREEVSDEDFKEQLEALNEELEALNSRARELEETIATNVAEILES